MTERSAGQKRTVRLIGIGILVVCVIAVVVLVVVRHRGTAREARARQQAAQRGPMVPVAIVKPGPQQRTLVVSAETVPYASITLYAKVSGYLREIRVDKGDRVLKDDLLAVIYSPELENQYRAALVDAENKRRFAERERQLLKDGIISRQEAENASTDARSAEQTALALKRQRDYLVLRAPFDGTVTARYADPGALLQSAATGQSGALAIVTLSNLDRLRVYAYLDQKSASQVKLGDRCVVTDATRPDRKYPATVSRISGQLDPRTRTMLVEFDFPNTPQRVIAGSYVQVTLDLAQPPYLQIPASALFVIKEKSSVAVVGADNRIAFRPVTVADSDGKLVSLSEGVAQGERVVLNPGTGMTEGILVQPTLAGETGAAATGAAASRPRAR
ncbi:efflux RND transporter periplasmic adaptor subunit [Geomesophilobacter sediminis]|uniref:Efflux RND transporter periplasmic adaptor subunit n=1 Tax=Geomesophilobacter sediminis TaxID=2798584 RepID=A0A8J7LYF8_9BACT|nr:efflux RND transporter periplasmic adaptor subunit [Geomesophilobacter sediminis]MBJ6724996.1 efflux RND transporter periplasmic adaptor subunit [Geomesophilobacter sediminis]